jgi:hypothetical protein
MGTLDTEAIARDVFAEIAKRFPSLQMIENQDDPVEISITMPVQPGLSHKVWLCLQNRDELGFSAGHFYCSWFPCTKSDRAEKYLDAVVGFLSGRYRILEYYRGTACYRAKLQKPEGDGWRTIANWAKGIPLSFKKTVKELTNQQATNCPRHLNYLHLEKEKATLISEYGLYLMPATTYAPTHFRVQYHRPCGA